MDIPSLYAIDPDIDKPHAWYAENAPEVCFAKQSACGSPLNDEKPDGPGEDENGESQEEQELGGVGQYVFLFRLIRADRTT